MSLTRRRTRGFTLLEMVAVLVILGVLVSIAAANWGFIVSRGRSIEGGAAIDRIVALEGPIGRDYGSYTQWPSDLGDKSTSDTVLGDGVSTQSTEISVALGDQGSLALAVQTSSGCIYRVVSSVVTGAAQSTPAGVPANAACQADAAFTGAENPIVKSPNYSPATPLPGVNQSIKTPAN